MNGSVTNTEQFLKEAASRIRSVISRTTQDIIAIGRDLIAVKERLGHGNFLPWIRQEFGMSDQTASNFMNVARRFGDKIPNGLEFQPTALYALAAPSTPPEMRAEIIKRAEAGEKVTARDVKKARATVTGSKKTPAPVTKPPVITSPPTAPGVEQEPAKKVPSASSTELEMVTIREAGEFHTRLTKYTDEVCEQVKAWRAAKRIDQVSHDCLVQALEMASMRLHQAAQEIGGAAEVQETAAEPPVSVAEPREATFQVAQHAEQHAADKAQEIASPPTAVTTAPAGPARERAKAVLRQEPLLTKREVMERAECGSKAAVLARRELEKAGAIAPKATATEPA